MKVLELYSGIGGMHMALQASGVPGEIIASADINTVANSVYKHNFPDVNLLNRNIQSFTPKFINKLNVDTILMSPPCQPFTRNGLKKDTADARTCSFTHVLSILKEINVENILIENVKGFESSEMRGKLVEALEAAKFSYQEFILSPSQVGVANTRHRYYCLATRREGMFQNKELRETLPEEFSAQEEPFEISTILQDNINPVDYYIPEKHLRKRAKILDICYAHSRRSCCFTKAYGRYIEGTGSVFTEKTEADVERVYKLLEKHENDSEEFMEAVGGLNLRFFSPTEVCRLMSFPETFSFPKSLSDKQKYMLLGNSINVKVVAVLIKMLSR